MRPVVIGIASSLVHTQPQYEKVAGYLLGRVLVMDTIEHAVMVARKFRYSLRIVTLEGELTAAWRFHDRWCVPKQQQSAGTES